MRLSEQLWKNFRWLMLKACAPGGRRRRWVLVLGIFAIVIWQLGFAADKKIDTTYTITAASGMHNDKNFVYFFWYLNQFPVASTEQYVWCTYRCPSTLENDAPTVSLSKADAEAFVQMHGSTLVQDITWTWYAGDRGKVFLFMLDTWLKGAPWKPSVRPMHRFCFTLALVMVFASMWRLRRPALGALLVLFVGSDPLQLFEVHANENVFGWNITTCLLMLAIHLPLLSGKRVAWTYAFLWPIGAGILLATIRQFRSEPMPILAAVLLTYALTEFWGVTKRLKIWGLRAGLIAAFFVSFIGIGKAWERYFEHKQEESEIFVRQHGGHPFTGPMRMYHHFWHPIWCGLGDFGTDKGYKWEDVTALAYARPILEQRYHQYVPNPGFGTEPKDYNEYWDAQRGFYKKLPYDMPYYDEVVRDKVLTDIKNDPKWYGGVLHKRARRVLGEATPVRISWWSDWATLVDNPKSGKLYLVLVGLAFLARARFMSKLLLFTLPTTATAMIIYCDRGIPWYGIFHLVSAAIWIMVAWAGALSAVRWWRRRAH